MNIKEDLAKLKSLMGNGVQDEAFIAQVEMIGQKYTSESDKQLISEFMQQELMSVDALLTNMEEITIKMQIQEVAEIVSLSWIAKKYFGKTKNWLYQRINGNTVNGKPCRFTNEEVETFNHALKDISQKIGSLSISY